MRVTGIAVMIALSWPALCHPQGLGDAAKRERERRQKSAARSPARVFTNDDSKADRSANPSEGTLSTGSATPPGTLVRSADATAAELDEFYWRDRVRRARSALDVARASLDDAQSDYNDDLMRRHPGEIPVKVMEPGCGACTVDGRQALCGWHADRACQEVVVFSVALHRKFDAALREEDRMERELGKVILEARQAGVPEEWLTPRQ